MKPIQNGVFIFAEIIDGNITEGSFELLGKAGELAAALDCGVTAVMLGHQNEPFCAKLTGYGADHVLVLQNPILSQYLTLPYTTALFRAVKQYEPEIFLFGATPIGRDLAPRLSARLRTGLTADCTGLEIAEEGRNLLMTRPAFGGNLMATIICAEHRPQMATVRPGVMCKNEFRNDAVPHVTVMDVEIPDSDNVVEILETVMHPPTKPNIREAKVLVSGGRGMGSPEGFEQLESLAGVLGGTTASSRAAVDAGWQPKDRQVGQTGQTVRPDLYIACGISGAIQHVAGMEESGLIIAINKDERAPIFSVADLGIVGNVNTVLPALEQTLRDMMRQTSES